ncbi:MAG: hypothetical protein HXY34_11505 [Candidatus Thorarchaeota archaeon]|nr:hypothetical protein [Candidatus Thorarchaeota archaeon]
MRVLVTSKKDPASQNILRVLVSDYGFSEDGESFEGSPVYTLDTKAKLITTERDMIACDHLEDHFRPEVFIFCSRHRAQSGRPSLLVHSTGNFGEDTAFGGQPRALSVSAPRLVSAALRRLYAEREERGLHDFDVSLEVTHHGPTNLMTPLLFVELGSDETYWNHPEGAAAVAAAVMDCLEPSLGGDSAIAFGGTHYASKFNSIVLDGECDIGHMAARYAMDDIAPDTIGQMVRRSASTVKTALIDWKGTNASQRERVLPVLEDLGIEIIRAK